MRWVLKTQWAPGPGGSKEHFPSWEGQGQRQEVSLVRAPPTLIRGRAVGQSLMHGRYQRGKGTCWGSIGRALVCGVASRKTLLGCSVEGVMGQIQGIGDIQEKGSGDPCKDSGGEIGRRILGSLCGMR